jgi:hypothetical protein
MRNLMPMRCVSFSARCARGLALAVFLAVGVAESGAAPAPCVGDCSGRGAVGINDLILAVNIVLELAPADECPALGAPPIGIAQVIASVGNALCACQPCPTAPPTPTGTPSPSPTPTPTYAVSNWREEQFRVTATDCPAGLAKRVRDSLKNAKENYIVRARGLQSEIEDGNHNVLPAEIDADGVLHARYTTAQQVGNCVQIYTQEWQVDLRQSPSAASYSGVFRTQPCNNPVTCTQSITSRWTFKSGVQP